MKLYIADLHFFHENMNTIMDKRGFASVEEETSYMIQKWNKKVCKGDIVYVLGDMFWGKDVQAINKVLHILKGKICLIKGNHDKWLSEKGVDLGRFEKIESYAEVKEGQRTVVVCHYPIFCYNHQYLLDKNGNERGYMLYGHVHDTKDYELVRRFKALTKNEVFDCHDENGNSFLRHIPCNMINTFCKFSDYEPLSLDEWIEKDREIRE